jgi:hypothetical protein
MTTVDTSEFLVSLNAELTKLADDIYREAQKAGFEIVNEAKTRTPVRTGSLRAAWKTRSQKTSTGGWVEVSNDVKYAPDIEYGTKPHTITAVNAKVLTDGKGNFFGKTVDHPGTRPRPMLAPALAAVLPRLAAAIGRLK